MGPIGETLDQHWPDHQRDAAIEPLPGVVLVASAGEPMCAALALRDAPLLIGRGRFGDVILEDGCLSRRHASIARDGRVWVVTDLGSRNGSALEGLVFHGERRAEGDRLLRVGDTLLLLRDDVRGFLAAGVHDRAGVTSGPTLREVWARIADAAREGDTFHVTGESGSGKELAARHFHASGPRASGPFVAVNCATIPSTIAERLLFGAKKGAFSGADADADGYLQSADGGTLFLDEIAELDLQVQAKLLRVLETREVTALGASRARKVSLGIISATHGSLRTAADQGRFRHDLFFRLGRPDATIPPLRARLEEIPFLVRDALATSGALRAHASLVEVALLRPWPGNVRELFVEMREAAGAAIARGADRVEAADLSPDAGARLCPPTPPTPPTPATPAAPTAEPSERTGDRSRTTRAKNASKATSMAPPREVLVAALQASGGNITHAARALTLHRTQLRRWLLRYGLDGSAASDQDDGFSSG